MKEMNDEELQRWLEQKPQLQADGSQNEGAAAYRALFEALNTEPDKGLPYDFSAKVTRHIQAEAKRSNDLKFNIVAAVLFIVAIAIACVALSVSNPKETSVLLKFKWALLLFPVIFIAIQYFDQRLVSDKIFHSKK